MSLRCDSISLMDVLIPIKTTTPKPPILSEEADYLCCPECRDEDDGSDQPDIRDLTIKELLEEDSGRGDTLRDMSDIARNMLGLPPLEHRIKGGQEEDHPEDDSEPQKDN